VIEGSLTLESISWVSRLSPQQQLGEQQNHKARGTSGQGSGFSDRRLSVILYGPISMATHVGEWLDGMKMYLQIPGDVVEMFLHEPALSCF